MAKEIKAEIKKFLKTNTPFSSFVEKEKEEENLLSCVPLKLKQGIKDITIKNDKIIIKTNTPSWRQEINFYKKEIMKKIHKKFRNYRDIKVTIL